MDSSPENAWRTPRAAPDPGSLHVEQRVGDLVVRIAVVNDHRQGAIGSESQLACQRLALNVRWRQVAEEVEPDLSHRRAARIGRQRLELGPSARIDGHGVVRMHADRRLDQRRMPLGQRECLRRRRQIPPGDQDALDARLHRTFDDGLAVGVESLVLEVAVRVDQPGEAPWRDGVGSDRGLRLDPRKDGARVARHEAGARIAPRQESAESRAPGAPFVVRHLRPELLEDRP